jgi:hypothetical protein
MQQLYKYFALHKHLALPGIGCFAVKKEMPVIDFLNKQLLPPVYTITFEEKSTVADGKFLSFLSNELGLDELAAIKLFNNYIFKLKADLHSGQQAIIEGIGILQKNTNAIIFKESGNIKDTYTAVAGERVIHENEVHIVKRGEKEVTNEEILNEETTEVAASTNRWWIAAAVLAAAGIAAIGIYYGMHH